MFSVWRPSWLPAAGLSSKRLCFKAQSKDSCCWICKGCLRCVCQQGSAGYQQAHLVSGMEAADAAPLSAGPHAAEAACTHAAGAVPPPPVPARQAVSKHASSPAAQAPQGFINTTAMTIQASTQKPRAIPASPIWLVMPKEVHSSNYEPWILPDDSAGVLSTAEQHDARSSPSPIPGGCCCPADGDVTCWFPPSSPSHPCHHR